MTSKQDRQECFHTIYCMASPKISIISERFNFQNIIQNNWLGKKKTRASNTDPLSKSNCIFPFCPLSFNFCYFPLNGVQELFPRHPLKSYLDSRASCEMLSLKYISTYETIAIYSHYSSFFSQQQVTYAIYKHFLRTAILLSIFR